MINLRRKVLVLSLVALAFLLLVIHLNFRPFTADGFRSFVNTTHYTEELFRSRPDISTTTLGPSAEDESTATGTSSSIALESSPGSLQDKILVVVRLKWENTDWVHENFPDWQTAIYTVNDPDAALHTSMNKGREANGYLTYIIENYSRLPSTVVFLHSHRTHDHGSRDVKDLDFDNVAAIKALKTDFVQRNGYANLRCILSPGCPAELQPFRPTEELSELRPQERAMVGAWPALFGNADIPQIIATPCCAQFAVSRDQILKRSEDEYNRFLKWLQDTPLDDSTSGRVFEYLWHIIFGREPVYCPDMERCYQDQYGTSPPSLGSEKTNASSDARVHE